MADIGTRLRCSARGTLMIRAMVDTLAHDVRCGRAALPASHKLDAPPFVKRPE